MSTDILVSEQLVELAPRLETNAPDGGGGGGLLGGILGLGSSFSLINLGIGILGQGVGANNGVNAGSFDF